MAMPLELQRRFWLNNGIDVTSCISEEWLILALDAEEILKQVGPEDTNFQHFCMESDKYQRLSALAESLEYNKNTTLT